MKTYKEFAREAELGEGFMAIPALLGKGALMGAGAEAIKGLFGAGKSVLKGGTKMVRNSLKGEPGEKKKQDESRPSPDSGLPRAS